MSKKPVLQWFPTVNGYFDEQAAILARTRKEACQKFAKTDPTLSASDVNRTITFLVRCADNVTVFYSDPDRGV